MRAILRAAVALLLSSTAVFNCSFGQELGDAPPYLVLHRDFGRLPGYAHMAVSVDDVLSIEDLERLVCEVTDVEVPPGIESVRISIYKGFDVEDYMIWSAVPGAQPTDDPVPLLANYSWSNTINRLQVLRERSGVKPTDYAFDHESDCARWIPQ
jgi:hypothetical protein